MVWELSGEARQKLATEKISNISTEILHVPKCPFYLFYGLRLVITS